jgi:hypothetical protein
MGRSAIDVWVANEYSAKACPLSSHNPIRNVKVVTFASLDNIILLAIVA